MGSFVSQVGGRSQLVLVSLLAPYLSQIVIREARASPEQRVQE